MSLPLNKEPTLEARMYGGGWKTCAVCGTTQPSERLKGKKKLRCKDVRRCARWKAELTTKETSK